MKAVRNFIGTHEAGKNQPSDIESVKTARFAKIVEKAGRPEIHLPFIDPSKDRTLQAAVKAHRVMTVSQESGAKTDRGEIGFAAGTHRQFLVFPKSLKAFAGRTVTGIKYGLLEEREILKSQHAARPKSPKTIKPKRPAPKARKEKTKRAPASRSKVIPFQAEPDEEKEGDEVDDLKERVRHAMAVLEAGKPVAAFNLLKRIVGD
jgi:hypothetical protein